MSLEIRTHSAKQGHRVSSPIAQNSLGLSTDAAVSPPIQLVEVCLF